MILLDGVWEGDRVEEGADSDVGVGRKGMGLVGVSVTLRYIF